jgi:4-amino-4-deoxy-L-arabinose transferase-like glycosyltransferase
MQYTPKMRQDQPVMAWITTRITALTYFSLALIVLLAGWLRFVNLEAVGEANQYYTSAVASMLQSWSNFFFVAAEPGGAVTVDKPPLGLWLQAISAYFFGVNGFAVVLPQILAGLGSIVLLFHLVRRRFGPVAGLLAALILAVTPVNIATERNNTMDATLVFVLLLAAWAFLKASETSSRRYLLFGAALIGIGFNIKMMQAFLPLPAFYALYFFAAEVRWWRKLIDLLAATVVIVLLSLAWAVAVDLTPADQRPYVGSSTNNTVLELIIGYNGVDRLVGGAGPGGTGGGFPQGADRPAPPPGFAPGGADRPPAGLPPGPNGGPGGAGGSGEIGAPGLLRMFISPLANEASWLLPFGLLTVGGLALGLRWRRPFNNGQRALLLWGGWLLTCVTFFSVASFYHAYYLVMIAPPLAGLVAIGALALWRLDSTRPVLASMLIIVAGGSLFTYQVFVASQYVSLNGWFLLPLALLLVGTTFLLIALRERWRHLHLPGSILLCVTVLAIPAGWSVLTTFDPQPSAVLPHAYAGTRGESGPPMGGPPMGAFPRGGPQAGGIDQELLAFLQANTDEVEYLLVVPSSMAGAPYVLATGRPVLYAGGFNGADPVIDADDLAQMATEGRVRYVLWNDRGPGPGTGNNGISTYLQTNATPVEGFAGLYEIGP